MNFEDLIAKVKTCGKQKLAVAAAEDDAVLEAVDAAHKQGIADAILVGDEAAIRKIAAELNIDLSDYEIINEPDKVQATSYLALSAKISSFSARSIAVSPKKGYKKYSPPHNLTVYNSQRCRGQHFYRAIPHNSKCRYGERGAADAKPKAQIILCVLSSILATQLPCRSRRSGA